ncbi:uncharacterized protein DUF1440 [Pontibacter ummariensis]|uniref:DUF1440 domain-containing protein n=1 Tax=Pontibacter ummariensis TaxID=1610492 RepID=A0A239KHQ9_9BACT|nr:DUF1440 domain-containing protein [Pontibacter ummariensis]PRY06437.1 uncharacterized protein DUF1440 [Pontibacter ummariensis]SNT17218.1 Protein of unknown function [Pontibacter ummariensis]
MASGRNTALELLKGAIAGAVSVWAMDRVTWYMYRNEDRKAFAQEKQAQVHGHYVSQVSVDKATSAMGVELSDEQYFYAYKGVHYFLGIAPAMLYSVLRHKVDWLSAGKGSLFGVGLFVLQDETLAPLTGLASPPTAYPWQAHARGLAGHLAVGLVTDATLNLLDKVLPE